MSNNNAAEKRWECFATLCKEMNELADEIIEWSEDGHYRDRLIHLYDLADTVFGAKNVKRLLAALEEEKKRNSAYANLVNSKDKTIAAYAKTIDDQTTLIKSMTSEEIESQRNANAQLTDALEEKDRQLARYSISPGQADQRLCESRAVREILGFPADSAEVSPADLKGAIEVLKESIAERNERLAELEQRLQQPIRLPHPAKANRIKQKGIGESDETYVRGVNDGLHYSAEAIRAAGFKVEGE